MNKNILIGLVVLGLAGTTHDLCGMKRSEPCEQLNKLEPIETQTINALLTLEKLDNQVLTEDILEQETKLLFDGLKQFDALWNKRIEERDHNLKTKHKLPALLTIPEKELILWLNKLKEAYVEKKETFHEIYNSGQGLLEKKVLRNELILFIAKISKKLHENFTK